MDFSNSQLSDIAIHNIGNKINNESCKYSSSETVANEELKKLLLYYFITPFKNNEYYTLFHETDLRLNEVYTYVSEIFDNSESFFEQSVNFAKHLYEQSVHPKIKGGEFYTVYFKDCIIDGITTDAVGLFKSENKDTFLKVYPSGDGFEIESEKGVNINKLDKGCLIFNIEIEKGYVVAVVDNINKGTEARYWMDDFLHVRQRKDEYYNTQNILTLCKNFVTKELSQQFEVSKADQVDFLNKSIQFFKEKESFDMVEFVNEVIEQPDLIQCFNNYKNDFQKDREIDLSDNFVISESAVKKQARSIKSIIKLDKNFHIYVHGHRELIEQGVDEQGRKFYKIYYSEES